MSTDAGGPFFRICFVASTPSTPGIAMSIRITSGLVELASATASSPSRAVPTTSIRSSEARMDWSASANRRWSSAMRTRILLAIVVSLPRNNGVAAIFAPAASARAGCALEHRLDAARLLGYVVPFGGGAGGRVGARQRGRTLERLGQRVHVQRVDEKTRVRRDELRRTTDPGCDNRSPAGHRLEDRLAEGLDEARLAQDARARDPRGNLAVRDRRNDLDAGPALEARPQRAFSDERQRPGVETAEGIRETDDVLTLRQRAEAKEGRLAVGRGRNLEAPEVDARVDHLGLAARLRHLRLELAA